METQTHHQILKLVGKSLMRNRTFIEVSWYLPDIIHYKGSKSNITRERPHFNSEQNDHYQRWDK